VEWGGTAFQAFPTTTWAMGYQYAADGQMTAVHGNVFG